MILAINTAQSVHELVLVENEAEINAGEGEILAEQSWEASNDDLDKLVPTLDKMLEETGLPKEDISQILVVTGPGPFTALRTGIAFANALAHALHAQLFTISTFELLHRKAATTHPILVILNAGGGDIAIHHDSKIDIGPISSLTNLEDEKHQIVTEVTQAQTEELAKIIKEKNWDEITGHKLQTLGESILTFGLEKLKESDQAEVIYLREPVITKSKDPWKKP